MSILRVVVPSKLASDGNDICILDNITGFEDCRTLMSSVDVVNAYRKRLCYASGSGCRDLHLNTKLNGIDTLANQEFLSFILAVNGGKQVGERGGFDGTVFHNISLHTDQGGVSDRDLERFVGVVDNIVLDVPTPSSIIKKVCDLVIKLGFNLHIFCQELWVGDGVEEAMGCLNTVSSYGATRIVFRDGCFKNVSSGDLSKWGFELEETTSFVGNLELLFNASCFKSKFLLDIDGKLYTEGGKRVRLVF